MTKHILIIFLLSTVLFACVMPEEYLKQTELHENDQVKLIYEGNRVYLVPKVSPNMQLWDAKVEYRMTKVKGGYAPKMILNYDSTNNLISSSTRPAIEKRSYRLLSGREKKTVFLDNKKHLFEPEYLYHAKAKYKFINDANWITKYYDIHNKPRCGNEGFKVFTTIDTTQIQYGDSLVDAFTIRTIYKIDCKGDTMK